MPRDYPRHRRVAEQLQRELAELIRDYVKDPRLGPVTVTRADVSRDLGWADVHVAFLADTSECEQRLAILSGAAGFLRRQLGRRMRIRTVPQLRFHYDQSLDDAQHMDRLIAQARASDRKQGDDED